MNHQPLANSDPELKQLIDEEKNRQRTSLELIASENYTDNANLECLGSVLTNKYSEGRAGHRYYGGNNVIDKLELLCENRARECYGLTADEWTVDVQPYSGSPANFAVYTGLLQPHDRIMGLDLAAGGHLTHGFYTAKGVKVTASSKYFESMPYGLDETNGLIDYDKLAELVMRFRPKLLICGASAYPRDFDYQRFRIIADSVGAILMCDMSHYSGIIATGYMRSPFEFCDIVTTTTHKTLRGPRSGIIFIRRRLHPSAPEIDDTRAKSVRDAVFPGLQGGPHQHQIAAVAHQLYMAKQTAFKEYIGQVIANARKLADILQSDKYGWSVCSGGTDCHMLLIDMRPLDISGGKMEAVCDAVNISLNKNTVVGDKNAMSPSGIRIGLSAVTTRGLVESDMEQLAVFLHKAANIAIDIQKVYGRKLKDWRQGLDDNEFIKQITELKAEVCEFCEAMDYYD